MFFFINNKGRDMIELGRSLLSQSEKKKKRTAEIEGTFFLRARLTYEACM